MIPAEEADPVAPRSHDDQREGDPSPSVIEPPPTAPQGQARPPSGDPPVPEGNVPGPANNVPVPGPARLTLPLQLPEKFSNGPQQQVRDWFDSFDISAAAVNWTVQMKASYLG
ncbi:hypothetical protein FOZ61_002297, partial [Perkinsus olseni]